jgi:hypothetical protein
MSAVPGTLDTERGPPMAVPLRHFAVAVCLLVVGCALGVGAALGAGVALAHVHLLLVGCVCVTVMGAMTQFVPVWSGVPLHSRRLASAQLWLLTPGVIGFGAALLGGAFALAPLFGAAMVAGVWVFAYNLGRTLAAVDAFDVTESHFAAALCFLLAATALGLVLALGFVRPVLAGLPVSRGAVVSAHVTLAVFGGVLTTVFGALYQLATVFTGTELRGVERRIERAERVGYPLGVVALAAGRLFSNAALARLGGGLVLSGALGIGFVLWRRVSEARGKRTPMRSRYAALAAALCLWAALAFPAWLRAPLSPAVRFGAPGTVHLLGLGVVGFAVLGTLYHVVPFIVWVERYSERVGLESVPTIEDLYDDRIAAADFAAVSGGTALLVAGDTLGANGALVAGGAAVTVGAALFAGNCWLVVERHSARSLRGVVFGSLAKRGPE